MGTRRTPLNLKALSGTKLASPDATILPSLITACALAVLWTGLPLPQQVVWPTVLLGGCLLVLTFVDARSLRLPDAITLPLIPAGLLLSAAVFDLDVTDHLLGMIIGGAVFAGVRTLYKAFRGHEGLGLGDVKMMTAAGAWLGWQGLPSMVFEAALFGMTWISLRSLFTSEISTSDRVSFGPFLCLGWWVTWLHGPLVLA